MLFFGKKTSYFDVCKYFIVFYNLLRFPHSSTMHHDLAFGQGHSRRLNCCKNIFLANFPMAVQSISTQLKSIYKVREGRSYYTIRSDINTRSRSPGPPKGCSKWIFPQILKVIIDRRHSYFIIL